MALAITAISILKIRLLGVNRKPSNIPAKNPGKMKSRPMKSTFRYSAPLPYPSTNDPTIVVVTATMAEVAATQRIGNIQLFRDVVFWTKLLVTIMLITGA
jgi:hypothetical protein